ncbi:MAG: SpoIIE family protein phosphatase [Candidatus Cloacimonetes bacterium]|nr:SpoIIE family protein phosphatase [Candidatus Cloacimonadota bacterium]
MESELLIMQDLKVLYCEDSEPTVSSLRNFLSHRFSQVFYAVDGIEGLQLYHKQKPDLIITDIRMPRLDGLQMARKIREIDIHVKIIIISAHTEVNYFLEAIDYGISAFIKKPVALKILETQINEMLEELQLQKRIKEEETRRLKTQQDKDKLFAEIRQDIALARSVQEYLLPDWLLLHDQIVFSTAYMPSLEVGGDLFGYFPVNESSYVFFLGDVSGHGLKSAMLMMAANSTITMLLEQEKPNINPARLVNRLNKILSVNLLRDKNYMTFILGVINTQSGEVNYIRAGHPEIIVFDHNTRKAELLLNERGTIPVGWLENYSYTDADIDSFIIDENKTCFIYSDGLFECSLQNGDRLGQEGLLELLEQKIPQTNSLTTSLEFMEFLKDEGYDISQDDFTLVSFFQPTATTIPGLKNSLQAIVPENIDLDEIECRQFLLDNTGNSDFAETFEKDINTLFQSEDFQKASYFISSFILLLIYSDNRIECRFWIKKDLEEDNVFSNKQILDHQAVATAFQQLDIYILNYLKDLKFKNLGDYLEINCILTPNPERSDATII